MDDDDDDDDERGPFAVVLFGRSGQLTDAGCRILSGPPGGGGGGGG